ncbi:metallophosphoesterase [Inconstantimicrobium mannanitabidum]|uniref:Metallophosphatase n=1 Tax=Inconstantimicrobium mannanitabidum TaxID=1604901 RepID=A0ACB5R857_9CLOT|nr:metallophosphoesterase [Clostridium sp. TW13]GKX65255.1 metallophosphatase [Clostridium sp. TW13]
MYLLFFLIPALCMIPIGVYIYFYLRRMAKFWGINIESKLVRVGIIILTLCLVALSVNIWGMGALIVLHVVAIALSMELINLVCKRYKKWSKIYQSGLIPILLAALIIAYGYWNMRNMVETDYKIYTDKHIQGKGYRIAMITDLHYGTTMNKEKLQKYCDEITKQNPDMVVLGGDIVDENTTFSQMQEVLKAIGSIKSTYGTYYVYGNHDKNKYSQKPHYTVMQLDKELENNKIKLLQDKIYNINDEFTIVGRDDIGFAGEVQRKSTGDLASEVDSDKFILLLDHQPRELKQNNELGYDLQLSGHTHAGQIWPVGQVSGILGFGELNYGYKQLSHMQIIVSSGMAGWGYPIRTGAHSEYVIIDIKAR